MKKVKVLFIRNLALQVTEENITSIFEEASGGPIDRVKKSKDYAFVHFRLEFQFFTWNREFFYYSFIFSTREQAELAYENTKNSLYMGGHLVEVNWSKPVDRQVHRDRKQLTKVLTAGNNV